MTVRLTLTLSDLWVRMTRRPGLAVLLMIRVGLWLLRISWLMLLRRWLTR